MRRTLQFFLPAHHHRPPDLSAKAAASQQTRIRPTRSSSPESKAPPSGRRKNKPATRTLSQRSRSGIKHFESECVLRLWRPPPLLLPPSPLALTCSPDILRHDCRIAQTERLVEPARTPYPPCRPTRPKPRNNLRHSRIRRHTPSSCTRPRSRMRPASSPRATGRRRACTPHRCSRTRRLRKARIRTHRPCRMS